MEGQSVAERLNAVREAIASAEARYGRQPGSVELLAVSKTKPLELVREAIAAGQQAFGENQLQDALTKIEPLAGKALNWHFIGPVQSNKTRPIASQFDWVHSIDRLKIAERLSEQRPDGAAALNVCVQFNVSGEASKSGVNFGELGTLCQAVHALPNVNLRGLMAIPAPTPDEAVQRATFAAVREAQDELNAQGLRMDTLSMGMTDDLGAAIAEGATMVRIGTAIFGARAKRV